MTPWYVWVLGRALGDGSWGIRGVFTSRDKALAVAQAGDFICVLVLDEPFDSEDAPEHLPTEYVE